MRNRTFSKALALSLLFIILSGCSGHLSRAKKVNLVVQTARSYTGTPYKYGGTTRVGIDCSALLFHSFNSVKVNLPRTSEQQAKKGKRVNIKDLQVGDMVFFATGKKRREINHAGIVTAVRGKNDVRFIHASTSLGVTESNLYSNYYRERFRRARRVF
ncbi:C40 family peptidase [Roseivirga sp.]|uniref:C40 family peptidase n=1 Tax=Roseivirga sp. TaxID=1964215 RepID=UPI003B51A11C